MVAVRQRVAGSGARAGAMRRVLVAGEFRHTSPWSVILALDELAAPCTTITIAVVAEHPGCTGLFLAYSLVPAAELRRELVREAGAHACRLAALAPPDVRVEHLATDGWRGLERHVAERRYEDGPRRRAAEQVARPPAGAPRGLEGLRLETHSNV